MGASTSPRAATGSALGPIHNHPHRSTASRRTYTPFRDTLREERHSSSAVLPGGRWRSGQSERAALGVSADGPPLSAVDDSSAEIVHALKRRRQVSDREVWKRSGIAWAGSALVDAETQAVAVGLPPGSRVPDPRREIEVKHSGPKPASPIGVVDRELDQRCGHTRSMANGSCVASRSRESRKA